MKICDICLIENEKECAKQFGPIVNPDGIVAITVGRYSRLKLTDKPIGSIEPLRRDDTKDNKIRENLAAETKQFSNFVLSSFRVNDQIADIISEFARFQRPV